MDEKEIKLEEELDEDVLAEEIEDEDEAETLEDEKEIEYETDEDGNVIIPDDSEKEDEEETAEEPEKEEENEPQVDPKDEENERLRKKLSALEMQAKDTLKKLGVEEEDVQKGLAQVAAEAEDTPVDEYLKKQEEALKAKEQADIARTKKYEEQAKADFEELKVLYPELSNYKSLFDLPKEVRQTFGRCRDLGLSVKESYAAANPDGIRNAAASAGKTIAKNDSKAHLKSSVPKRVSTNTITIPKDELQSWMDDLGVSKKEAIELYKQTLSK